MSTKPYLIVFITTMAVFIVSAVFGSILESNGTLGRLKPGAVTAIKVTYFTLFCVLVLSLVPLALSYFIAAQVKIGNGDAFLIQWIQPHQVGVVIGIWAFFVFGLFIALPAMKKGGFFE